MVGLWLGWCVVEVEVEVEFEVFVGFFVVVGEGMDDVMVF